MKLATLQGMRVNSQTSLNGLSRVTPAIDANLNGFARVNYMGDQKLLQGLMLSGLMLSGNRNPTEETLEDFECYMAECMAHKKEPSPKGYGAYMMQGKAERKARRAARRAARAAKKSRRARSQEARTKRQESGEGFFQQAGSALKSLGERGVETFEAYGGAVLDEFGEGIPSLELGLDTEKGYLLGKPPFEPWTGKWWSSKRVPIWQKGAIVAVAAIGADQIVNKGKFTNPLIGKKARK